jgi:hypothetical protein
LYFQNNIIAGRFALLFPLGILGYEVFVYQDAIHLVRWSFTPYLSPVYDQTAVGIRHKPAHSLFDNHHVFSTLVDLKQKISHPPHAHPIQIGIGFIQQQYRGVKTEDGCDGYESFLAARKDSRRLIKKILNFQCARDIPDAFYYFSGGKSKTLEPKGDFILFSRYPYYIIPNDRLSGK